MKVKALSAVLCLAAATTAINFNRPSYTNPYMNSLEKRDGPMGVIRRESPNKHDEHHVEAHKDGPRKHGKSEDHNSDENNGADGKDASDKKDEKNGKMDASETDNKSGNDGAGKDGKSAADGDKGGNAPAGEDQGSKAPAGGNNGDDKKSGGTPSLTTDPSIPRDYVSPLWLVQPVGSSVWEQGRAYVITWGPNPDPAHAKLVKPKSSVDIRLMQGPPAGLHEIAMIAKSVDESLHSFQWTVPNTVTPAKDYTIRITQGTQVDTYSHYFEVTEAGDPRSSKSNVGEPILLPQKGDTPHPLDKGPIIKPNNPPNPFPADKATTVAPKIKPTSSAVAAAKPVAHTSAASETKSANMLAFALTLFGAVYFV
ncbi:hypothetical protein EDD21DRAFT_430039 [Dissophora ornata]|nr:hypothetical protein BGZ58_001859 [Dissophora ornata]KAI8605699.1 hypothetical protein EDD21DRAFT_430039 [Dissophora ornata]